MAYIFDLAGNRHQSAPPCVESLRRRECDREEGMWRAQDLEFGIYMHSATARHRDDRQCPPEESLVVPG